MREKLRSSVADSPPFSLEDSPKMSARNVAKRKCAEVQASSPARIAGSSRGKNQGSGGPPAASGGAPSAVWQWQASEHNGLLTYHDGAKRWYHCRECDYFNDRLYHCKMHYDRIHVKEGKAMARKRKYPATDLPDVIPSVPDVHHPVVASSPRRCVSSTPRYQPKTTESHTPNTSASAAPTPLNVVGGVPVEHPSPSPSSDSRTSKTTPLKSKAARRSPVQASRKPASSFSALDSTDVWDVRNSMVLTFGEGVFFSDSSSGPGLSIDVAKLQRPAGVSAPGKPAPPTARLAKAPAAKKAAAPRKKKEIPRARPGATRVAAPAELHPIEGAVEPLVHLLHMSNLVPLSPPREQKVVFTSTPTQSPHRVLLHQSPPQTLSGFGDMFNSFSQHPYPDASYLELSAASPMVRGYPSVVLPSRDSIQMTPDASRMVLPGPFAASGLPSADSAMGAAHRAPSQTYFKGGRQGLVQGLAGGMGHMEMPHASETKPCAVMHSPMASPLRANSFLNLSSVPVTPVQEPRARSLVGSRREGSAEIFSSLKSPITAAMDSFMSLGGGRTSIGSETDFLICCEELP